MMMNIKISKGTKKGVIKRKLKFQDYKNCLKAARLERKINYLEKKIKISVDCIKRHQKEIIMKNFFEETIKISVENLKAYQKEHVKMIILKKQQRLKSEGKNVYMELINNIVLYYKRRQKKHNPNWPEIPDHPYRILIIGGFGSGKTNALLNLINNEPDIDKIYLYAKESLEEKYQLLINKRESMGFK